METSIAKADTQREPQEGAGQAGEVLSDGTAKLREMCLHQSADGGIPSTAPALFAKLEGSKYLHLRKRESHL